MRPHRLRLQAFGCFPDLVELDLDQIGGGGLVLLAGPTGAGKTTLLDAIGYALFGKVPGTRADHLRALRSDHAAPDSETWVELEFSAAGRRLKVTRRPEQQRAARRGGGTVLDRGSAFLQEWDGSVWQMLAQRVDAIGTEVTRLLGMTADQFFQVVLLPQGGFDAFLRAPTHEREDLLKQLFHVERFEVATEWLAERARGSAQQALFAQRELEVLAGRMTQAGGELAVAPGEPGDAQQAAEWAAGLLARAAGEANTTAETAVRARARAGEQESRHADVVRTAERQQARRQAIEHCRRLEALDGELGPLRAQSAAARRALPVAAALAQIRQREQQRTVSAEELEAALRRLGAGRPAGTDQPDTVTAAAADRLGRALTRQAADTAQEAGALSGALPLLRQRDAARESAREAQEQATARRGEAERIGALLRGEQAAGERAAAQALERAEQAASRMAQLRAESALAADLAAAQDAEAEAARLTVLAQAAEEHARAVRQRRIESMTAELASTLDPDTPCPVCGALEHPDPALFAPDSVSRTEETEAAADARRLAQEAASAHGRLQEVRDRIAVQQRAQPEPPRPAVEIAEDLAATQGLADGLAAARRELERRTLERSSLVAAQSTAAAAHAQLLSQAQRDQDRADELDAALRLQLAGREPTTSVVSALAGELEALCAALTAAAAALTEWARAQTELTRAQSTAAEAAAEAGFADLEEARQAGRPAEWLTEVEAQLAEHDAALSAIRSRLASPELAVDLDPAADLDGSLRRRDQARREAADATAAELLAANRLAQLSDLAPAFERALDRLGPLQERQAHDQHLAELTAGRSTANCLRMSLSTYVLAARLEQVAEAATLRLSRMSAGRYSLVHSDQSRDKRSYAGLTLQVEDGWTGHRRDTATLSGGESFMASLSLALGLADVVTAEAGGRHIETLFVDEGFGSLDPDSLDQVMDVLDDLRSGGRLVGVVSHVAGMAERIPSQIQVLKTSAGSRVTTTHG